MHSQDTTARTAEVQILQEQKSVRPSLGIKKPRLLRAGAKYLSYSSGGVRLVRKPLVMANLIR